MGDGEVGAVTGEPKLVALLVGEPLGVNHQGEVGELIGVHVRRVLPVDLSLGLPGRRGRGG